MSQIYVCTPFTLDIIILWDNFNFTLSNHSWLNAIPSYSVGHCISAGPSWPSLSVSLKTWFSLSWPYWPFLSFWERFPFLLVLPVFLSFLLFYLLLNFTSPCYFPLSHFMLLSVIPFYFSFSRFLGFLYMQDLVLIFCS